MRATRTVLTALTASLLLVLAGCGGDDSTTAADPASSETSDSASPSASDSPSETAGEDPSESTDAPSADPSADWPACGEVWVADKPLPRGYAGCMDGDTAVQAEQQFCSFGRPLVTYADRFYAVPTGPVQKTRGLEKDRDYRSALKSCTA